MTKHVRRNATSSKEERGKGANNYGSSTGASTRATSPKARAESVGSRLLRDHPDLADCGGSALWRSPAAVPRARGHNIVAGHDSNVCNRRELRSNGQRLPVFRVRLFLHQ